MSDEARVNAETESRPGIEVRCTEHDDDITRLLTGIRALESENDRLRDALRQAYQCCARPSGVCFDPSVIDGRR